MRAATTEELKIFFFFFEEAWHLPHLHCTKDRYQHASHFWMPAHSMGCVPPGSLNPWEQENQGPSESINTQPWPGRPQPQKQGVLALGPNPTSNPRQPRHARALPRPPTGPRGGPAKRGSAGGVPGGGRGGRGRAGAEPPSAQGFTRAGSARPEGRPRRRGRGFGQTPPLRPVPRSRWLQARERGPLRLRVGVRSAARTRLLVLLVEFFNHLGRLPSAQTHRNRPRRRSRRAEDAAGRPAPCSHTGWTGGPSLGAKARPPRAVVAALAP